MKATFTPETDRIEDVIQFVEYCYDRGLTVHVETVGEPKRKRLRNRKREKQIQEDAAAFAADSGLLATTDQAAANGHTPEPKVRAKKRVRLSRKKRAPEITREIYTAIKDGDPGVMEQYAPSTISAILSTGTWSQYTAYKKDRARKAREDKSSKKK